MPLSDHEQRLLDEIEQALYADDPKFAATVRKARSRSRTRRIAALCVLGTLVGLGLVLVGLVANVIVLSVLGFVLVVGSCGYGAQTLTRRDSAVTPENASGAVGTPTANARQQGLRSRMEERLRRRFDES